MDEGFDAEQWSIPVQCLGRYTSSFKSELVLHLYAPVDAIHSVSDKKDTLFELDCQEVSSLLEPALQVH